MTDRWLGRRLIAATRLARWEGQIERGINAALDRHRTRALANVRAMTAAIAIPDPFDVALWDAAVDEEVGPIVVQVMREVADGTLDLFALPTIVRARVLGTLDFDAHAATMIDRIRNIGPAVADALADSLRQGAAYGEGIPELNTRVQTVFGVGERRGETIARTETHGAAENTSYTAAGAVHAEQPLTKTWLATLDDRTRDTHVDADGQTVAYDESFDVGGDSLDYPGDPSGSAEEVVNCRCTVTYQLAEGGETEEVAA